MEIYVIWVISRALGHEIWMKSVYRFWRRIFVCFHMFQVVSPVTQPLRPLRAWFEELGRPSFKTLNIKFVEIHKVVLEKTIFGLAIFEKFERGSPMDHPFTISSKLAQQFYRSHLCKLSTDAQRTRIAHVSSCLPCNSAIKTPRGLIISKLVDLLSKTLTHSSLATL